MKEKFRKIKETMSLGNAEVPECVRTQCRKHYLLALLAVVAGIMISIIHKDPLILLAIIVPTLGIAGLGYMKELNVSKNGYLMIKGRCEKIEYTLTSQIASNLPVGREIPSRYLIRNELFDTELYSVPYFKQNPVVYEGDMVAVYYQRNVKFMKVRGALVSDNMLGYEVLSGDIS